jgi:hypothetical protein
MLSQRVARRPLPRTRLVEFVAGGHALRGGRGSSVGVLAPPALEAMPRLPALAPLAFQLQLLEVRKIMAITAQWLVSMWVV